MTFQEALLNPAIEKQPMVVIRARVRVTGWTAVDSFEFTAPFTRGYVTRVWLEFRNDEGFRRKDSADEVGLVDINGVGDFYYDHENRILKVSSFQNPDDEDYPGITVEFEIPIASYSFCGPRDPLDATSEYVEWHGGLSEVPMAQNGSSESLYGFYPLNQSGINVLNGDGALNELLYGCSFSFGLVKAYIAVDHNVEKAMFRAMVRQVFLGYTDGLRWSDNLLQFSVTDFLRFFDRAYSNLTLRFDSINFPNVEPHNPDSLGFGQYEWYVRRVLGMKDGFRPVNIDYADSASASTSNNRVWVTHLKDGDAGSINQVMDHAAANTNTRTYFVDTPQVNVGDWIRLNHASGVRYTEVEVVNRALKYIEHEPLTRTVASGETIDRSFIGRVIVEDSIGQSWWLEPFVDFTEYTDTVDGIDILGFTMADNWENSQGFTDNGGVFDPAKHKVCVRVYGTKTPLQFPDSDPVSEVVNQGGIAAAAVDILYRLVRDSGFSVNDIDKNTFENIAADSHALGIAIPPDHDQISGFPTYKDMISQVLDSMLWRMAFVEGVDQVKVGLVAVGPFVAAADLDVDETQHAGLDFVQDYGDIYWRVTLQYFRRDEVQIGLDDLAPVSVVAENLTARDLHFSSKVWNGEILQYDETQAQKIADRLSYALGDRRGLYKTVLDAEFISTANLGASIALIRQQLPGFAYQHGVERERQLMVIEVQNSSRGVSITLEDQKGIQDNSGAW